MKMIIYCWGQINCHLQAICYDLLISINYCLIILYIQTQQMKFSNKSSFSFVISFFLMLGCQSVFYPYNDSRISFKGRFYTDSEGLRYDWPCSGIEFCFSGVTKISWEGSDGFGHYNLTISNSSISKIIIPSHQKSITLYQSNIPLKGCLSFTKITEDHYGPLGTRKDAIFKGIQFQGTNAQLIKKDNNYRYSLEYIGDSLTSAFGDMSGSNPVCFLRMRHNQNCLESWAVHLSKMLNADYRIEAQSGKGVVKNAAGVPPPSMSVLYTKTTSNSKQNTYHYEDNFNPDCILINLGANDYSAFIKPSSSYFIFAYQELLQLVARTQIQKFGVAKKIIGICYADYPEKICNNIKQAIKGFRYGYQNVFYVEVPKGVFEKDTKGCIGHLNVKGQRMLTEGIYQQVKAVLDK